MSEIPAKREADGAEKFLLAEYGHLSDSFWKNEESGEKRVNFLITLVTAVLTAIVALATRPGALSDEIAWIAFASCMALLVVGLVTFLRMIRRNTVTDEYKRALDEIRERFHRGDATGLLDGYDPFQPPGAGRRRFGRGGLTDLVAVVNSVIVAAAVAALVTRDEPAGVGAVSVGVAFAAGLALHYAYLASAPEPPKPSETEATLVVIDDAAGEVARAVAALSALDGFALLHRPDEAIRDRYFDTPDGKLEATRTALRLREVGPRRLLGIKGPSRPGARGGETRDEQEEEWPDRAWALLREELGTTLGIPDARPSSSDPADALRSVGLAVVQKRNTSRLVRAVVAEGTGRPVAELAVDSVVFHLVGSEVHHHEIEVEAKAAGGDAAVAALSESLVIRFWPSLRPWRHGKLPTGKAVATLIEERGRGEVLTDEGSLLPSAYDAIADVLARDRAGRQPETAG